MDKVDINNFNGNPLNMLDALANLKKAGFGEEQAEAVVRIQYALIDSHLATKQDIKELELKFKKEMKELELRITSKLYVLGFGVVGLTISIILGLARYDLFTLSTG